MPPVLTEEEMLNRVRSLMKCAARRGHSARSAKPSAELWSILFNEVDDDHSGALDFNEIKRMVRVDLHLSERVISDPDLQSLFSIIDTDGSGTIDFKEFMVYVEQGKQDNRNKAKIVKEVARAVRLGLRRLRVKLEDMDAMFVDYEEIDFLSGHQRVSPDDVRRFFRVILQLQRHDVSDSNVNVFYKAIADDCGTMLATDFAEVIRHFAAHDDFGVPQAHHKFRGLMGGMRGELPTIPVAGGFKTNRPIEVGSEVRLMKVIDPKVEYIDHVGQAGRILDITTERPGPFYHVKFDDGAKPYVRRDEVELVDKSDPRRKQRTGGFLVNGAASVPFCLNGRNRGPKTRMGCTEQFYQAVEHMKKKDPPMSGSFSAPNLTAQTSFDSASGSKTPATPKRNSMLGQSLRQSVSTHSISGAGLSRSHAGSFTSGYSTMQNKGPDIIDRLNAFIMKTPQEELPQMTGQGQLKGASVRVPNTIMEARRAKAGIGDAAQKARPESPPPKSLKGKAAEEVKGHYHCLHGADALNRVERNLFRAGIDVRGHYHARHALAAKTAEMAESGLC